MKVIDIDTDDLKDTFISELIEDNCKMKAELLNLKSKNWFSVYKENLELAKENKLFRENYSKLRDRKIEWHSQTVKERSDKKKLIEENEKLKKTITAWETAWKLKMNSLYGRYHK